MKLKNIILLIKKFNVTREEIENIFADAEGKTDSAEIPDTEDALLALGSYDALTPPPALKNRVMDKLRSLGKQSSRRQKLDLNNLPLLQDTSNWFDWKEVVEGITPPEDFDNIYLHTLELSEKRELNIVWVRNEVPMEVHTDLLESFLILEGSCECEIADTQGTTRIVRLGEGDYFTMQIGQTHNIKITSLQPTKAILQWLKVA